MAYIRTKRKSFWKFWSNEELVQCMKCKRYFEYGKGIISCEVCLTYYCIECILEFNDLSEWPDDVHSCACPGWKLKKPRDHVFLNRANMPHKLWPE